jgi:hypothetical protein
MRVTRQGAHGTAWGRVVGGRQIPELEAALHRARGDGTDVRALVVINPGNPTGQCLTLDNMKEARPPPLHARRRAAHTYGAQHRRLWRCATASGWCCWPTRYTK